MTAALTAPPISLARQSSNRALTHHGHPGFNTQMSSNPPTKAEIAAAARAARRAAQEAAALRANLHRRKEQDRARKTKASAAPEGAKQCP